jgi:hypothetical protein
MKNSMVKLGGLIFMTMQSYIYATAQNFTAEKYVQGASIVLNANIDKVFPLFGAMEEKKWAADWHPTPVYPASGNMEEGFIFQSPDHVPGSPPLTWVVAKYDLLNHQVTYIITSANRVIIISVNCTKLDDNSTKADITYQLTGLTEEGNEVSHHLITSVFKHNLKDWETAINTYLIKPVTK